MGQVTACKLRFELGHSVCMLCVVSGERMSVSDSAMFCKETRGLNYPTVFIILHNLAIL